MSVMTDSFQSDVRQLEQDPICLTDTGLWRYLCGTSMEQIIDAEL